jgi:hypothetical protein
VLDLPWVLPDQQLLEVVEDAEHAPAAPGEARFPDARQPFVGADEHDDHGVLVAWPDAHG